MKSINYETLKGKPIIVVAWIAGVNVGELINYYASIGIDTMPHSIFSEEMWQISYKYLLQKFKEKKKDRLNDIEIKPRRKKKSRRKQIDPSFSNVGSRTSNAYINSDTTPWPRKNLNEKFKPSDGQKGNYSKLIYIRSKN